MNGYFEPSPEQGRALMQRGLKGPVVMLNLLRFRARADYAATPELTPSAPISGREAYQIYMAQTAPLLSKSGGALSFLGEGGALVIGPEAERWDLVLLVRHASVEAFIGFARDPAYLAGIGHRTAALEDSRLLPLTDRTP